MNTIAINQINDKLKDIPDNFIQDVLEYLDFLSFRNQSNTFHLSKAQLKVLEERSKTPIDQFVSSVEIMNNLKNKFSV
ncbi:MAG: hypothetical protein ACR2IL_11840 [Chitinophagaceae bacterium]